MICTAQPVDQGLGQRGPLGHLVRLDADVLFLGTDWETCTAFHLADYRDSALWETVRFPQKISAGQTRWHLVRDVNHDIDDFPAIGVASEKTGMVRRSLRLAVPTPAGRPRDRQNPQVRYLYVAREKVEMLFARLKRIVGLVGSDCAACAVRVTKSSSLQPPKFQETDQVCPCSVAKAKSLNSKAPAIQSTTFCSCDISFFHRIRPLKACLRRAVQTAPSLPPGSAIAERTLISVVGPKTNNCFGSSWLRSQALL